MFESRLFFIFAALAVLLAACGASAGSEALQVSNVWTRPALAGGNGAVFFVVDNPGADDALLSAASEVAGAVELHMTVMQDGNMQMMQMQEVALPSGKTAFEPGGLHVMLIGLKSDLKAGDTFTVTLDFKAAGERTLTVTVKDQ
jgi:copper(I)-binding protein